MTDFLKLLKTYGACRTASTDLFFPPYDSPSGNAPAIKICERCLLKGECLEWALTHDEVGVWGGTGEADRRALLRKRNRVHCVTCGSDDIMEDGESHEVCMKCGLSWEV